MKTANLTTVTEIIDSWGTFDSVRETAANGVSEADLDSIQEIAERDGLDADSLAADLLAICRERVANAPKQISISMDGIWAGSGVLRDGTIENCGAQFCSDNDASLEIYDDIETAIAAGKDSLKVEIDGDVKTITWSLT